MDDSANRDPSRLKLRERRLGAVVENAKARGIRLQVDIDDDSILLGLIERNGAPKGTGAIVLDSLCAFADEERLPIFLAALGGEPKLVTYYRAFGFELDADQNTLDPVMVRAPSAIQR